MAMDKKYTRKHPRIDQLKEYQVKPKWRQQPTKAIRVPEIFAPHLLAIAKDLDDKNSLVVPNELPMQIVEGLIGQLSSNKLKLLKQEIECLIPEKIAEEEEYLRKSSYQVKLKTVAKEKIIAVYAPYDPTGKFQSKTKAIANYSFTKIDDSWRYPLSEIAEVLETFPESDYIWDERLKTELEKQREKVLAKQKAQEEIALLMAEKISQLVTVAAVDKPLLNGWYLRDYQKQAVIWLLARIKGGVYHGGILADDMGLGKTLESLVAALAMQKVFDCHVFVICPVSLGENWVREAEKVGVSIEVFSNHYRKIPTPVSTPYLVISDEAHAFQDPKSKRTKIMRQLIEQESCLGVWLLTGTPIKNGAPINLFPLLEMVEHKLSQNKPYYLKHFCNAHYRRIGKKQIYDVTGAAHLAELSKQTEDVILRRTKQECLPELPPKTRIYKNVELESKQEKAYKQNLKELIDDYRKRVAEGEVDAGAEALVTINFMRKTGSIFKVPSAIAIAEELLEQGQQVIIFSEFLESANAVYEALEGELLVGGAKNRQEKVDRFQSGESKVFTGTIKAGGVGLTLTAASNVILIDRPWTPGDAEQAEDRAYRLGQNNAVFVSWLQLGHIDLSIDNLIIEKKKRIELILKGKKKILKNISSAKELALELLTNFY